MMSFSLPTSHLNAAPAIEAATTRAAALSISATTTFAAPARCRASQSARPMPLAPPVTTTVLPLTCIGEPVWLKSISGQNQIEHGGIMAGRAQQHEAMPDHVLEAKPGPGMKDNPETIEKATGNNEPDRQLRRRRQTGIVGDQPAPAHRQIKPDRYPVEAAREKQFQHDADCGHA